MFPSVPLDRVLSAINPKMASVVLKSLSVLLGIFFVFVGAMKLSDHISKDLHKDLVSGAMTHRLI